MGHDLPAVEVRANGRQLFLFPQLGDARLEFVHALSEGFGLLALRVVQSAPGQLVELLEQRPASRT